MASEFTSFICLKGRVQQNFRGCYGMVYLMRRIAIPVLFPFTSMSRIPFSSAGAGLGPWHFQRIVWIKRDKNLTQSPIIKQAVKICDEVGNQHKETGMETSIKANTLKSVGFLHVVRVFLYSPSSIFSPRINSPKQAQEFPFFPLHAVIGLHPCAFWEDLIKTNLSLRDLQADVLICMQECEQMFT